MVTARASARRGRRAASRTMAARLNTAATETAAAAVSCSATRPLTRKATPVAETVRARPARRRAPHLGGHHQREGRLQREHEGLQRPAEEPQQAGHTRSGGWKAVASSGTGI